MPTTRTRARPVLFAGWLLAAGSVCAAEVPNVVLILTDDQGYGDLSCHGNPVVQTPHLDRLYAESIRLTDFHVVPVCAPTRGQLLSGMDSLRNGAMNVSSGRSLLRRGVPTMADVFGAAGYRTGIFGKWHLGDNYPYRPQDRGFHESLWFPSSHINSVPDCWDNDYFDDTFMHNGRREQFPGYCTDVFVAEAMRWMSSCAAARKRFFAYVPLNAPHWPHFVPDRYRTAVAASLDGSLPQLPELSPPVRRTLISFLAMIANIDENVGRLEQFLVQSGLRENTVMIFLTDNGSSLGPSYFNAGMKGGKFTLWEGGHRVPCFIRWPAGGLREPGDVAELTQVQDLLPTLVELCGLRAETAGRGDGISLAELLRGQTNSLPDRMLVINYSRIPDDVRRPTADNPAVPRREGAAVLWKRWRLLEDKELYNLDDDPLQERNVIQEYPHVAARMRRHLDQWWSGVVEGVNVPERVVIGSRHENPSLLTACEWFDVFFDQQRQVRQAERKNGFWYVEVAESGEYEIELRRWPREANRELRAGQPVTPVADGQYEAGISLPIAAARLQIGSFDGTVATAAGDQTAVFRTALPAGPARLQTWFLDEQGEELCGAYYVSVRRQE